MSGKLKKFFVFKSNSVLYRLTMAFGLFFMGPFIGLVFLSVKSNLFGTNELLYCLVGLLVSTLFGFLILRHISDGIIRLESDVIDRARTVTTVLKKGDDELENIAAITDVMSENIRSTGESLTRRVKEIHGLRELNDLTAFQMTVQSLASTTLARAMEITEAIGGSILLVSKEKCVCKKVSGEGVLFEKNDYLDATGLPGRQAILDEQPVFLDRNHELDWEGYFSADCKRLAIIPFGEISGAIFVAILTCLKSEKWDDITLDFLTTYFSSVGSALKLQEIGIRSKETTSELKTVLSIIKILNSKPQNEDLLSVITRRLEVIIPHDWLGLAIKGETDGNLYLSQAFGDQTDSVKPGARVEKRGSLLYHAMQADELIVKHNLTTGLNEFEKELFAEQQLESCIFASIGNNGKSMGVICLGSRKKKGFTRKDKRVLSMVAMGVAIALEQTRLLGRERAKRLELEVLNKIGAALSSHNINTDRVLKYVLDKITDIIAVKTGTIMLLEYDTLVIKAAMGPYSRELMEQRINLDHGQAGYVVATGEPVTVENIRENQHIISIIDEKTGFVTRNLLCVPMISGGRVIGVIELLNKTSGQFSEEDIQTVKAVSALTAIALENWRLFNESKHVAKKERFIRTVFQKYVPEKIVMDILEKGETDQVRVGEKRIVTIFNVDIRGYSRMSKLASTENVVQILNTFFKRMGGIIIKHNGVLDKYLGDGLLAIFGAPVSSANPALDAVLAAQEMVQAVEQVSLLAVEKCGLPIKIGVSINTGEAIVGNIGFEKKMEYTVIGDVVNETFRLQDCTRQKPNSILISETTYQQVKSSVKTSSYGLKKLDGTIMNVYEVLEDDAGNSLRVPDLPSGSQVDGIDSIH